MIYNLALLLPCAVSIIGAVWLICQRKNNTRSQKILTIGFLVSAVFFYCTAIYIGKTLNSTTYLWWDIVDNFATLCAIPTMYLYFRSMIHQGGFIWKDYIWFFPTLFVAISGVVLDIIIGGAEMHGYIQTVFIDKVENHKYTSLVYVLDQFVSEQIYYFTAFVQIIGTSILAFRGVRKYHQQLREFYSDADDKAIFIDTKIIHWFLAAIPLSFALIVPDISFWQENPTCAALLFIL